MPWLLRDKISGVYQSRSKGVLFALHAEDDLQRWKSEGEAALSWTRKRGGWC